jgi:hypothetical protein
MNIEIMKKIVNIKQLSLSAIIIMLLFAACKEEKLSDPDRLFRPIVSGNIGGTWITAIWDRYEGSLWYQVEFSEYEDFSVILKDTTVEETSITIDNLEYNTEYFFRIQAFGNNIESRPVVYTTKTGKYPTKLFVPVSNDMIDTQARVRWEDIDYDSVRVFTGKTHVKTVVLTPAENADKVLIITDLAPTTTYTVKAYLAGEYKGEQDYKTAAAQVFEGDYVDLRGLSAESAYSILTQEQFDSWAETYPNGFTVVLEGGMNYEIPTINMSVSTKIVSGLSFLGPAVWQFNGGIGVNPSTDIGYITLEGLIVTDHPSALRTSANYGARYLIDIRSTNAENKVGEIKVIDCDVRYKRGFLRAQAAIEVEKVTIENCVIDSMGGYGVVNADNSATYIKNVVIKNTTISHSDKILVDTKSIPVDQLNSVLMENVTIATKGSNYVLDYPDKTIPGGITIKNCLFGNIDGATPKGMRSASSNITVDECFRASDVQWTNPIEMETLSETTAGIFVDANSMNFRFKPDFTNSKVVGKIGDPRWW